MFSTAVLLSFLAAAAAASPVRRVGNCPWNGTPDANGPFTFLATYDNDTTIQKPLALGSNGEDGIVVSWLGTTESIASVVASNFTLTDNGITAYPDNGTDISVSDPVASTNGWLSFIKPDAGVTIPPSPAYCELFNTSPHGTEFPYGLAVASDSDHFSLCKSLTSPQELVIYNATEDGAANSGFDFSSCDAVHVHIIITNPE
ncbi:hypothetical protein BV25DRAFT_1817790 [Artomyces pyxidatus]|uniref:Uncharacterized protein n=1 Tax=Artomyces pyxidatus TaxID=48021 RepID=A0ACB8TK89_9AGAM|nr:hypothetical protein BV25DRAFT_1817790 [Artomyces pyxidatus]